MGPMIATGDAGSPVNDEIDLQTVPDVPQEFDALTHKFPPLNPALKLRTILLVPSPDVIVLFDGAVQLYEVAPITGFTLNDWLVPIHEPDEPTIEPGVPGN